MGLGVGLLLTAVGAVLAFAVNATVSGVDIHTIGWILMIVGIVGILLSLIFWSSWAGPGYMSRRRTTYVDEGPAGPAGPVGPAGPRSDAPGKLSVATKHVTVKGNGKRSTRAKLTRLSVSGLAAGSTVKVSCAGVGCGASRATTPLTPPGGCVPRCTDL